MAQLAQLSWSNAADALFLLAVPQTIDLSGIILSNDNGDLAVDGVPINPNRWSNYSTLNSTIAFNISSATLLASENAGIPLLSFNNNQLAYASDIPDLANWAMYPANNNVDISGYNISNVSTIRGQDAVFSTIITNTFIPNQTIQSSTIQTSTITTLEAIVQSTIAFDQTPFPLSSFPYKITATGQYPLLFEMENLEFNILSTIRISSDAKLLINTPTTFSTVVDFSNVAPINLPGIDGTATSTVTASTITAPSLFTNNISTSFVLLSTLKFSPDLGGINIDMGMGNFFGAAAPWAGATLGLAVGGGVGVTAYQLATGYVAPLVARVTNYLTPGVDTVELINVTTQLQVSTVGAGEINVLRLLSTTSENLQVEEFVSTAISSGAICIRSLSDPLNTISTAQSSFVQAFGQWTVLPQPTPIVTQTYQATYFNSVDQNLISGNSDISFDSEAGTNNVGGYITHTAGTTTFTVQISGHYFLEFNALILPNNGSWSVTQNRTCGIDVTRAPIARQNIFLQTGLQGVQSYAQSVTGSIYLDATDVIQCRVGNVWSAGTPVPPQAQGVNNTFNYNTFFTWTYVSS